MTKLKVRLNTMKLRQIIDFVNRLKFKSFEIIVLTQFSKSTNSIIIKENKKSAIITNDSEEIRKNKCKISDIQNYKKNCKFLFIIHFYDDKNE